MYTDFYKFTAIQVVVINNPTLFIFILDTIILFIPAYFTRKGKS